MGLDVQVNIVRPDGTTRDITNLVDAIEYGSAINLGYANCDLTIKENVSENEAHIPDGSWLEVVRGGDENWYGYIEQRNTDRNAGEQRTFHATGPACLLDDNGAFKRMWSDSRLNAMRPENTNAAVFGAPQIATNSWTGSGGISLPAMYFALSTATAPATNDLAAYWYEVPQRTGQTVSRITFDAAWNYDNAKFKLIVNAYSNGTFLSTIYTGNVFGSNLVTGLDFTLPAGTNRIAFFLGSVAGVAGIAGWFGALANVVIYYTNGDQTADVIFADLISQVPDLSVGDKALSFINVSPFVYDQPTTPVKVLTDLADLHPDRCWAVWGPKAAGAPTGFEADWWEKGTLDPDLVDVVLNVHDGAFPEASTVIDQYDAVEIGYVDPAGNNQSLHRSRYVPGLIRHRTAPLITTAGYDIASAMADAFLDQHQIQQRPGTFTTQRGVRLFPSNTLVAPHTLIRMVGASAKVINTGLADDPVAHIVAVLVRPYTGEVQIQLAWIHDDANHIARLHDLRRAPPTQPLRAGAGQWQSDPGWAREELLARAYQESFDFAVARYQAGRSGPQRDQLFRQMMEEYGNWQTHRQTANSMRRYVPGIPG